MKVLVVQKNKTLVIQHIPPPEPGPYEALVKIEACGICSTTDWEIIRGTQPYVNHYPCVIGHEGVGEVVAMGKKVTKFNIGNRVTRPSSIWPGKSREGFGSAWGGFAEYGIVVDAEAMKADGDTSFTSDFIAQRQNLVPEGMTVEEAVLAISLSETSSWFYQLEAVSGKSVCISGTGVAGLSLALWSKLCGAKSVIVLGRREERLALAKELGADFCVNIREEPIVKKVRALTGGRGVDLFLEASGQSDQVNLGASVLCSGGVIAPYGTPAQNRYELDWGSMPAGALLKVHSEDFKTYAWVCGLMKRKIIPVEKILTHRWPLESFETAFRQVAEGKVVKGFLTISVPERESSGFLHK